MRFPLILMLALAWTFALSACGGKKGEEGGGASGDRAAAGHEEHGSRGGAGGGAGEMSPQEMADSTAARLGFSYRTQHDPARVFTVADVPQQGGYMKLDFEGLDDAAVNRVLHRFMTEPATCDGCDGLILDEVLRNLPDCGHCIIQARKLLREIRSGATQG
jgi:hypothetical protein